MRGRAARARDAMEPSTATLEDLTPVRKRLQVEVPADAVQAEPDRTFPEVEAGDVVRVDLTSRLEGGEPVHREGVLLEAGSGSFPLALERQLVGQSRGARLALRVPYPADYPNAGLAGKTAEFEVEIKELRVKELPALDDDFARDHGKCA